MNTSQHQLLLPLHNTGGTMGQQIARFDWGQTQLGAIDLWPQQLLLMVRVLLTTPLPMCLYWNPDYLFIYNDAFIPLLGSRHPHALGQPAKQIWSDQWQSINPDLARVFEQAQATQCVFRLEAQHHLIVACSPVINNDGEVDGVLCTSTDHVQATSFNQPHISLLEELAQVRKEFAYALQLNEERLREHQTRLEFILETAEIGSWDLNLVTQTATRSLRHDQIFGYDHLLPTWTLEMFNEHVVPEDRVNVMTSYQYALEHHLPWDMTCRIRRADGALRWIWARGQVYHDQDDQPAWMLGIVADITERKQAEERDRFLFQLLNTTRSLTDPEQITLTSAQLLGHYLQVDRCAYATVEADQDHFTITGNYTTPGTISIIGHFAMADFGAEVLRLMRLGEPYIVTDSNSDPRIVDHTAYHATQIVAVICVPMRKQGRFVAAMAVHQRAPRQWTAEEVELVELVANMCWESIQRAQVEQALRANEEHLQTLYTHEQVARQQAEEANRLKDEFLAVVSHELRTPLTAILGYSQLLQSRKRDEAYIKRATAKIENSAKAQMQLIEDLLDMSRIITGKLRIESKDVDLREVIEAAIDSIKPALDSKELQLSTRFDPTLELITGDSQRLQQVMWNLLSNAVKFTPAGGSISIHVHGQERSVLIEVRDTGQGIATDFLPYVFDRFRQADSASTRTQGGLGLGLAIVRHLVESHGGTVNVESAGLGQGTTFTLSLPQPR